MLHDRLFPYWLAGWLGGSLLRNLSKILKYVGQSVCMYVYFGKCVTGHNFEVRILIFPVTLSGVRIEKDQISTKSVAISHSYDQFSYLTAAFTNIRLDFEVCHSDEWIYSFVRFTY